MHFNRKITLGTTYYNNPGYLLKFIKNNIKYVDEMIIVDDGSNADRDILKYINKQKYNNLRVFKVKKDYGFNSHGCRNLIMSKASNDWVVLLDLDREFINPSLAFSEIKSVKLNTKTRYCFLAGHYNKSVSPDETKVLLPNTVHQSVNDYLIHKSHFFSAGGYDEELIGLRNGDRQFFEQLLYFGNEKILHSVEISLIREATISLIKKVNADPSIRSKRDKLVYSYNLKKLIEHRIKKPDPRKKILTFEWEEVN